MQHLLAVSFTQNDFACDLLTATATPAPPPYLWDAHFRCESVNSLTLYPWIHQFSNNKRSSDQTRSVSFPDIDPQSLPITSDFSMVAGDFCEVYTEPGEKKERRCGRVPLSSYATCRSAFCTAAVERVRTVCLCPESERWSLSLSLSLSAPQILGTVWPPASL